MPNKIVPFLLSPEVRRNATSKDSRWAVKAALRGCAAICALLGVCLLAAAISQTNANFVDMNSSMGDWTDGLALAPCALALLYNPAVMAVQAFVRRGNPVHPAVNVVLDAFVWLLAIPAAVYGVAGGLFWYWTTPVGSTDNDSSAGVAVDCGSPFNQWTQECTPVAYTIGKLEIGGLVFLFFLFFTHLILFIYACLDLHRRRLQGNITPSAFDMEFTKDVERSSRTS